MAKDKTKITNFMKIFGFTITRGQKNNGESQKSFSPLAWLGGADYGNSGPSLIDPFCQVSWVYRAASVLAEQIANIPFLFSRGERGRENLITSGPLIDFYNQPHPHINRFQYWELRILWLLLRGECFRVPIYEEPPKVSPPAQASLRSSPRGLPEAAGNGLGIRKRRIRSVVILSPDNFTEIVENHQLLGWRYKGLPRTTPLETQVFLPEEVWHDKLPNPFNFWRGIAPILPADQAIRTDYAASSFMRGYIENNADNGLTVRTNDQLDDTQKEQLIAALNNRKRKAGCADRPLLLWSSCEIVKPQLSSADLQFLENRKFSRSEICAALGVPEEIVSTTDHNKYDVMQGARLNFIENRVAPLCARLEASEQGTVRAIDRSAVGWFDLESLPIMQAARRERLTAAKTGFEMGIPFNELNRVLDLGFPEMPDGNTGYLASNLHPVGGEKSQIPNPKIQTNPNSQDPIGGMRAVGVME